MVRMHPLSQGWPNSCKECQRSRLGDLADRRIRRIQKVKQIVQLWIQSENKIKFNQNSQICSQTALKGTTTLHDVYMLVTSCYLSDCHILSPGYLLTPKPKPRTAAIRSPELDLDHVTATMWDEKRGYSGLKNICFFSEYIWIWR